MIDGENVKGIMGAIDKASFDNVVNAFVLLLHLTTFLKA